VLGVGALLYNLPTAEQSARVNRLLAIPTDRDCADFSTQAEAQLFFRRAGPGDPHRLDGNGDGRACELSGRLTQASRGR